MAAGALTDTGVDGQVSAVLGYPGRTQAVVSTTLWAETPTRAAISGTEGRIEVEGRFYRAPSFTVTRVAASPGRSRTRSWRASSTRRPRWPGGWPRETGRARA